MWRKRECFWRGCWCLRGYVFHGKSGRRCQKNGKYPNNSHRSGFFLPTTSHLVSSVIFGLKIKTCHALLWTLGTVLRLLCPKPSWLPGVHLLWIEQAHSTWKILFSAPLLEMNQFDPHQELFLPLCLFCSRSITSFGGVQILLILSLKWYLGFVHSFKSLLLSSECLFFILFKLFLNLTNFLIFDDLLKFWMY